ncbi:MAG: RNA polymerase sigma factor [Clostridia bacterium]|nr:RNA polymerase sigma factor [Clostridia bacterium]
MLFWLMLGTLETDEREFVLSLYVQYKKYMFGKAMSILHSKADAEDAVQTVMVNIIKNIEKFFGKSENEIERQIVIYLRNAAINLYNHNKRKRMHEDGEMSETTAEEQADLEKLVIDNETIKLVRQAIALLPEEMRDTVKLVYVYGYSNIEAAQILGITANAVGMRLYKARKKILEIAGEELLDRYAKG